jgi:hypothetical protein
MTVLSQFTLTNATPRKDNSPVGRFRRRVSDAISVQIDLAKAEISGEALNRTRQRWVTDPTTGANELKTVSVRVRRWWWQDDAGKTFLTLKYGAKVLEIAPGKSAIEIAVACPPSSNSFWKRFAEASSTNAPGSSPSLGPCRRKRPQRRRRGRPTRRANRSAASSIALKSDLSTRSSKRGRLKTDGGALRLRSTGSTFRISSPLSPDENNSRFSSILPRFPALFARFRPI